MDDERLLKLEIELQLLRIQVEELGIPPSVVGQIENDSTVEVSDNLDLIIPDDLADEDHLALVRASCPFKIQRFDAYTNKNWKSRCGCGKHDACSTKGGGKSFFTVSSSVTKYDTKVILVHFKKTKWADIDTGGGFKFYVGPSYGLTVGQYVSSMYSSGGSWGSSSKYATLGFEVYRKGTLSVHSRWLLNPNFTGRGEEWFHCGQDYTMVLVNP